MASRAFLLAIFLLLLMLPLSHALQQIAGAVILKPPHFAEAKYIVTTGDENEPKTITVSLSEELRPYISISPSETFDMQPHTMKEILVRTNYTGDEPLNGMISVTATPLGGGGGAGAVISIRLDKPVVIEAYNETLPFKPPELPPSGTPNATSNQTVPPVQQPGVPYQPTQYETQIVVEPWVWAVGIFILLAIGVYAYRMMESRKK
ncbi:MAG: hypothetical protein WC759_00560 [Candidatus Micrarchaeia archaeon]|jgi:hypothetical protein